eukprot:15946-Heterococcus_DN1.PRE.1
MQVQHTASRLHCTTPALSSSTCATILKAAAAATVHQQQQQTKGLQRFCAMYRSVNRSYGSTDNLAALAFVRVL